MVFEYFKKMWSSNRSLIIAVVSIFLISMSVRSIWTFSVQRPGDAVYSDMKGYIGKAQALISGTQEHNHNLTVNPYGAHYLYALEMLIFGKDNYTAMAVINVLLSSAAVVLMSLCARRCFSSISAMWLVGITGALWYPIIAYNGYFSSEIPFSFFLCLSIFLTCRYIDSGKGALLTGLVYGIGFAIRPQLIMTAFLFVAWVVFRRKHFKQLKLKSIIVFIIPVLMILGFSAYRYHHFTGDYALISGNGPINKLFGGTNYAKVVATEKTPDGKTRRRYISPPPARNLGYTEVLRFEGYVGDADIIGKQIKAYRSNMSLWEKVSMKWRNVSLLAYRNTMWPERNQAKKQSWRLALFEKWPIVVKWYWFPLACLGLVTLFFRRNLYLEVLGLHFVTMLYAAFAYIGEIRYRVPYDLLLTVFAAGGLFLIFNINRKDQSEDKKQTDFDESDNKQKAKSKTVLCAIALGLIFAASVFSLVRGGNSLRRFGIKGTKGSSVYYDAVHGARHLFNRDNRRYRYGYHSVSGFNRFCKSLRKEGFNVHAEEFSNLDRKTLDKYDIFFIGEQTYHARLMTDDEQKVLMEWVKDGGSLLTLVEHSDAHYMSRLVNGLLKDVPLEVRYDSIMDWYRFKPNSRTTWVNLSNVKEHPTTQGVKEYHFLNGASLDTAHGVLFSTDTSWSDRYNKDKPPIHSGNVRRDPNELSGPLAGAAALEYGKGKIIVIGDHNAFSNPNLYYADHYRFIMNCMRWLGKERYNCDLLFVLLGAVGIGGFLFVMRRYKFWQYAKGTVFVTILIAGGLVIVTNFAAKTKEVNFFVHTGNKPDIKYMTRSKAGYYSFYGQWTKEPQLHPWASQILKPNYDALFLTTPLEKFTQPQLEIIDGYIARGKTVVYLATADSLESEAGLQLQDKFKFKVKINRKLKLKSSPASMYVYGDRKWTQGIFRFYRYKECPGVLVDGLETLVYLADGKYRRALDIKTSRKPLLEILSRKKIGSGQFILLAPMELYNNKCLSDLYKDGDVIREQMAELVIRLAKIGVLKE
jgi:hypothetical protein